MIKNDDDSNFIAACDLNDLTYGLKNGQIKVEDNLRW